MIAKLVTMAAAAAMLPSKPVAQPNPPSPITVAPRQWVRLPTRDDLERLFPSQAKKDGLSGRTWMQCGVAPDGTLRYCALLKETPENEGFGSAALESMRFFQLSTQIDGQQTAGGTMVIPIVWQNSNGAVPPPAVDPSSLKTIAVGPTGIPPLTIPPPPQLDYDDPSWIEHPTSADVEASRTPAIQHIGGEAILTCRIERDGSVSECRPRDETPAGSGFAAAAMTLTTKFKAKPLEGYLIRSAVRVRVRYSAPSP